MKVCKTCYYYKNDRDIEPCPTCLDAMGTMWVENTELAFDSHTGKLKVGIICHGNETEKIKTILEERLGKGKTDEN